MTKKSAPSPFKDCTRCQQPVHARSAACKACGAPSPWKAEESLVTEPATEEDARPRVSSEAETEGRPEQSAPDLQVTCTEGLHLIDATTDDLNPSTEEVAAYMHDLTAPQREEAAERAAEREAENGPHVFMEAYHPVLGNVFAHFKQGQVVTDFPLIQQLKALGAPMVPWGKATGMACCPQCKTVFRIPSLIPAKRVG